jgi:NAD(P)-dependent dehydrogenase (short-subunit alcohol dehydrogenase family)
MFVAGGFAPSGAARQEAAKAGSNAAAGREAGMAFSGFDLTGKVALVTGGNGGIGLAMAEACAQAGADIAIWGQNPAKNEAARTRLAATGRRVLVQQVDVGSSVAVDAAFGETLATLGRVDACFANAGTSGAHRGAFADLSDAEWDQVMKINLDAVFYTFRAAARHMVARGGGGSMIVTSSLAARMGAARNEHYGATKGAVISLIQGVAVEYARHGIRANAILPGWVETEMTEELFGNPRFAGAVMPRMPMRRWGAPEDFAGIAVYLASDASRWHTGDSFLIDGGYLLF